MNNFWTRKSSSDYDFRRLVDTQRLEDHDRVQPQTHIVCDIDKTYLETQFESVVAMAKLAFEEAGEKIAVAGAPEVLLAARWGGREKPQPLHFVSSSPPQLRGVLAEKLALDGLDWNSDTFKNQAYNLRKGRMDLLKHHVAYKSAAILSLIQDAAPNSRFILIGDNAENDSLIFLGIKLLCEHRLSLSGYHRFLQIAGVQTAIADDFMTQLKSLPESRIGAILIRQAPGYQCFKVPPLTDAILTFPHFFTAALLLIKLEALDACMLGPLMRDFHNRYGLPRTTLAAGLNCLLDILEPEQETARKAVKAALQRLAVSTTDTIPETLPWPSLSEFRALTEEEILEHCSTWVQALSRRGRR